MSQPFGPVFCLMVHKAWNIQMVMDQVIELQAVE